MSRVAALGPEYTFSHILSMKVFPAEQITLKESIGDVFKDIIDRRVDKGIIPIENLVGGPIRKSIDGLSAYPVKVNQAYIMPIHHCLAAQYENYKLIMSIPEALEQCSHFLADKGIESCKSTAHAMKVAAYDPNRAAIGAREAAEYYDLRILQENIEDNHDNVTKFFVISLEETIAGENARTSLILKPKEDRPGLLFQLSAPFALKNINFSKIESIPTQRRLGESFFYLEMEGNVQEERVKSVLDFLKDIVDVYSSGSYNVADIE
jgi:prephenate dehydratase